MDKIKKLYNRIKDVALSQEYLELERIEHMELLYPLQKLEFEEWEKISDIVADWTQEQRQVLADSLIEINDNKESNYDISALYGYIFTLSNDLNAESMLENFDFIENGVSKNIELIDGLMNRLKNLEGKTKIDNELSSEYKLINKLYNNAIC